MLILINLVVCSLLIFILFKGLNNWLPKNHHFFYNSNSIGIVARVKTVVSVTVFTIIICIGLLCIMIIFASLFNYSILFFLVCKSPYTTFLYYTSIFLHILFTYVFIISFLYTFLRSV